MWELPYVSFVSDDAESRDRASVAHDQFTELLRENGSLGWGDIGGTFHRVVAAMTNTDGRIGIDNHSRGLFDLEEVRSFGNSADADNVVIDIGIVTALELRDVDVVTNTVASDVVSQRIDTFAPTNRFSDWHIDVARELATIRIPNRWGPRGGYHPSIEDLRLHPQVGAFRSFLEEHDADASTAAEASAQITELADRYARQELSRAHEKRPMYRTIGRAAVKPAGNAIYPGLGTAAGGVLKVLTYAQERRRKAETAWAAFVADLRQ